MRVMGVMVRRVGVMMMMVVRVVVTASCCIVSMLVMTVGSHAMVSLGRICHYVSVGWLVGWLVVQDSRVQGTSSSSAFVFV